MAAPTAYGIFPGQGWNLCYSSNPSCCRDKAGSLTLCTTKEQRVPLYIGIQLIYNVLVSGVQQSDSVMHIQISIIFQILFPYRVSQTHIFFFFFSFVWPHLRHMEVPGLGVESELQIRASCATATATPDLCRSLWQCQILNPQSKARDRTCILTEMTSGP